MMKILSLIENLKRLKINLSISDGNIVLNGKNAIPSEFLDALKANKGKIISFIGYRQLYVDFFNECAGILEYDAGLDRKLAEYEAWEETLARWLKFNKKGTFDTDVEHGVSSLLSYGLPKIDMLSVFEGKI